jgi:hypothetical protein
MIFLLSNDNNLLVVVLGPKTSFVIAGIVT